MSTFGGQLAAAAAAVQILSPTRYSWLGAASRPLARHVERNLGSANARGFLVSTLEDCLYDGFYCPGSVTIPSRHGIDRRRGDARLIAALSSANAGTGRWEPGWKVRRRSSEWIEVEREGLVLRAAPEECNPAAAVGGDLAVRFPSELLRMAPGFYMALTDRALKGSKGVVRLYWNLRADGAVSFVREATSLFSRAGTPAQLKVVNDPRRFDRCDAAVLYVGREDLRAASDVSRALYVALEHHLEPSVPSLTKQLAPGVALAEDPSNGGSFGQDRCGVIAEGIVRAHEQGLESVERRVEAVRETMREFGIDPEQPYLNAGSSDVYDVGIDELRPTSVTRAG